MQMTNHVDEILRLIDEVLDETPPQSFHTHECRDCGATIDCSDPTDDCDWEGGNSGCDCDGDPDAGFLYEAFWR
jgi:hypothetical protein